MKQQENELCKLTYETNKKLCQEAARLRAEAAKQYRDDLCRQIDYNNRLRVSYKYFNCVIKVHSYSTYKKYVIHTSDIN